ncbi:putative signal peptide protein [Puccinia sorghi]|uniref:Putative signal peptide protein n=1 Tax=Puccinia sorghi TaxID=27349 RepID=A0A0L6VE19_9BASI|nr:putative signal peptide protein [Puccinia sorghi]
MEHRSKYRCPSFKQVLGPHFLCCMWLWNVLAHADTPNNDIILCRMSHNAVLKHVSSRTYPREIPLQKICTLFNREGGPPPTQSNLSKPNNRSLS